MFRSLIVMVALSSPFLALAQEMPPVLTNNPTVKVSERVTGEGTEAAPFIFTIGMKGDIQLATDPAIDVSWELSSAPKDTEPVPKSPDRIWFPTEIAGRYVVSPAWTDGTKPRSKLVWFVIQGNGGVVPTPAENPSVLIQRAIKALAGPDAKSDAKVYKAVCEAVIYSLENKETAADLKTAWDIRMVYKTSLDTLKWQAGKYPELSTLAGELFGEGVGDKPLDDPLRAQYLANFKALSKACSEIMK